MELVSMIISILFFVSVIIYVIYDTYKSTLLYYEASLEKTKAIYDLSLHDYKKYKKFYFDILSMLDITNKLYEKQSLIYAKTECMSDYYNMLATDELIKMYKNLLTFTKEHMETELDIMDITYDGIKYLQKNVSWTFSRFIFIALKSIFKNER